MVTKIKKILGRVGTAVLLACLTASPVANCQALRDFTVTGEIGLARFGDSSFTGLVEPFVISPDHSRVAAYTERGLIEKDRPEGELRIYDLAAIKRFVNDSQNAAAPQPLFVIRRSTHKEGPIISAVHWLRDSSGVAFLLKTPAGTRQLYLADLVRKTVSPLTQKDQDINAFDVCDRTHFVFTVRDTTFFEKAVQRRQAPSFVATGLLPIDILTPIDDSMKDRLTTRGILWAARDRRPAPVRDSRGRVIPIYADVYRVATKLSLSPDGNLVATTMPFEEVPQEWKEKYLPRTSAMSYLKMTSGPQDLGAPYGQDYVSSFATIDLRTGKTSRVTNTPTADSAGWTLDLQADWTGDGRSLLLPGVFLPSTASNLPCIAVADLASGSVECVDVLKADTYIQGARFVESHENRVVIDYYSSNGAQNAAVLAKTAGGIWKREAEDRGTVSPRKQIEISVKQAMKDPPVLFATDASTKKSRAVWDPNPKWKQFRLGEASAYRWRDGRGREWLGGLYKPVTHVADQRYPLVIQTHGFPESHFEPSGAYPAAFAARALAAAGITVLQTPDCEHGPDEGACAVEEYESAVRQLEADGLIDPERVGIIGFSHTCYYVMEMLTTSKIHLRAASITDGVKAGYLDYLLSADWPGDVQRLWPESVNGASPFGPGLQKWLQRSPEFNLDRVTAPLQVFANSVRRAITMLEPYAALRLLHKPVDMIVLNVNEHILTNPGARLASQGGTVDWFRFWLKGEEDPDPSKAEQYARWRALRKLQVDCEKQKDDTSNRKPN